MNRNIQVAMTREEAAIIATVLESGADTIKEMIANPEFKHGILDLTENERLVRTIAKRIYRTATTLREE